MDGKNRTRWGKLGWKEEGQSKREAMELPETESLGNLAGKPQPCDDGQKTEMG